MERPETNSTAPSNWPTDIAYLKFPAYSDNLTASQLESLRTKPANTSTPVISLADISWQSKVSITTITDTLHPAHGQVGLFARTQLPPDSLVAPYLGLVYNMASSSDQDRVVRSDYDIALSREDELGIDAAQMGNEARCVNDYRDVPANIQQGKGEHTAMKANANAEFRDIWMSWTEWEDWSREGESLSELENAVAVHDEHRILIQDASSRPKRKRKRGARGIGIFVLGAGKSGKRKAGIKAGEEVLVSYGKGFWSERQNERVSERVIGDSPLIRVWE